MMNLLAGPQVIGNFYRYKEFNVAVIYNLKGDLIDAQVIPLTKLEVIE